MPDVQGRCPACGGASLFLGSGGHVTCSRIDCPAPGEADDLLHGKESDFALSQTLGGRPMRLVALVLHAYGCSIDDVRRMTDEEFLAVPGIGREGLARIRCAFPAPSAEELRQPPSCTGDVLAALGRRIGKTLAKPDRRRP
ncbi:hypothetical protein K388_05598 [Streptomyces sp. KhCrAH-43]|uniref:DUF6085 family protein n=1 Tax=unclassified Streptomyces TaxID=2593676 RepID=UPI00035CD28B|nr:MULTISPECIES: DUF6085 family protein [unclassified Streptomyces]MYX67345.1 hypothetical protein [Streptomyces sp. SID8373]RAJ53811.1 hypothetical protein K388_05598 [Streptomyces sp. KhCrAH-43]